MNELKKILVILCVAQGLSSQHNAAAASVTTSLHSPSQSQQLLGKFTGAPLGQQILIKQLTGEVARLNVVCTDSVESVKHRIQVTQGIPVDAQTLLFNGRTPLENGRTLGEYNITPGSTVYLVLHQCSSIR